MTVTVYDVAAYILARQGDMTAMKLQKLCYYAQAWHLVWEEQPLFPERIEAWANGPIMPDLYAAHRGQFRVSAHLIGGDANKLTADQAECVNIVLGHYGQFSPHQLSDMTHRERPWTDARAGLNPGDRGNHVIPWDAIAEFYDSQTRAQAERCEQIQA
jgi:uncharacterized phage-associated protein